MTTLLIFAGLMIAIAALATLAKAFGYSKGYDEGQEAAWPIARNLGYQDAMSNWIEDMKPKAWREGRDSGIEFGRDEGKAQGHNDGYLVGREHGHTEGYLQGHKDGYLIGHSRAIMRAQASLEEMAGPEAGAWSDNLQAALDEAND